MTLHKEVLQIRGFLRNLPQIEVASVQGRLPHAFRSAITGYNFYEVIIPGRTVFMEKLGSFPITMGLEVLPTKIDLECYGSSWASAASRTVHASYQGRRKGCRLIWNERRYLGQIFKLLLLHLLTIY